MKKKKRFWSHLKTVAIFGLLLIGILSSLIAALNMRIPTQSAVPNQLSANEQHRITEAIHLRRTIGNQVWPGWSEVKIPFILYNESHVFLAGSDIENTTAGWTRIPYNTNFGTEWNLVKDQIRYYRQPLPENGETPQAFVVQVGDQIAASMTTKEWTKINLVKLIKEDLPGFLKPIFPYQLFINKFDSDWHIASLIHESFHAFQAHQNYSRFENAEKMNSLHDLYPWSNPDFRHLWVEERKLMAKAIKEPKKIDAKELILEWLTVRETRRSYLDPKMITYEKEREWLEGLAKYAEIKSWQIASDTTFYKPLDIVMDDPDFSSYQAAHNNYDKEILQLQSDLGFSESVFYYSGWAQAELLDRFYPNWKAVVMKSDIYFEELLKESMGTSNSGFTSK